MIGLAKRMTAAALLAAAAAGSMGCELIATVDRSKIDQGTGGGSTTSTTSTTSTGSMDVCGDGMVTGAEACDDGNTTDGDGCDKSCAVEAGYDCKGSPSACTPVCGDGKVVGSEGCDDGNTTDGDGCDKSCAIEPGFSCDGMPSMCTPGCGDGMIAGSEKCDDGNMADGDGCSKSCAVEDGWTCTGTPSTCTTTCGDGIPAGAEECDDGNTTDGDGCDMGCKAEHGYTCTGTPSVCASTCGDGIIAADEECDDKNTLDGDGCSATCKKEAGWTCTGEASVCTTTCGDGIVAGPEACDDANTATGDGCDDTCKVENGWTCTGTPLSTCVTTCGDGIKAGAEQCDDGNTKSLDGCNAVCKIDVFNETEPNDTSAQANGPFSYDVLVHGAVKPGADPDWFAIQLTGTADLTLETFDPSGPGSCANIDTVITFYGTDGTTVLATDDDAGINSCSKLTSLKDQALRHLPAGTYFVKVAAYAGYAPIPGYTLGITFDALCGDGKKSGFEECDGTAGCAATCDRVPSCGDGFIDGAEQCDDGNTASGDGCSSTCQYEILAETEPNGTPATAGMAHTPNVLLGGAISTPTDTDFWAIQLPATADLKLETFDATGPSSCADIDTVITLYDVNGTTVLISRDQGGVNNCSRIDPALDIDKAARHLPAGTYFVKVESHANASTIPGYTLLATYGALCGNGIVEGSEECDGTPGCTATCDRTPVCGDGLVDAPEQCDDGNTASGDGCSASCQYELVNEVEANDTSATANGPYTTHALIAAAINPATDVDYFAITLSAVSDIKIETYDGNGPGSCDNVDTVATLYGTDGTTVLVTKDDGGIAACSRIDPKVDAGARHLAPGTYFVKIEDFKNNTIIPAYRVEITFTAVCGNGKVEGAEECDGTANCDASCNRIPTCGDGFVDAPETCDDGNTANGDGCSSTCVIESIGEAEPNDTTAQADASGVQLAGPGAIAGAIGAVGDKDFFKLTLGAAGVYRFETLDPSGVDCTIATTVRLFDSGGAPITSDDNSGMSTCSALTLNLAAGSYYVSVEQQGNTATIAAYLLKVTSPADGGADTEPNDTKATATAVVGTEVFALGSHQTNGDTDFFAINVPAGKSVRAEIIEGNGAETCESLDIDSTLTLYDANGVAIDADDDSGRGFCSLIDGTGSSPVNSGAHALPGGVYYLAVEASPFAQGPTDTAGQFDYRLVITIR
jgi:cysteine-rich repeat protein